VTDFFVSKGMAYDWAWFLSTIIGILVIALPLMLAVAMIIYAERKIWAAIALRRGPNVVGPWGLLQSFADGLKVFLKETIIPSSANKGLFLIAPIITFTVALIVWAVVPFDVGVVLTDINVGLLYILAASSLGVYGVIIAGWASNSKYPFFSALRAAAQMVSYEVSIGFVLICVVLYAGTFNLTGIVLGQKGNIGFGLLNGYGFNPLLFPMAVVFLISSMAETFRTPFDLVEAESELVAGHQTEYSSMSFRALLARRICQRHPDVRAERHPLLGRLPSAAQHRDPLRGAGHHLAAAEDGFLLLRLRLGEGDRAEVPLRPADAAGLENLPAAEPAVRRPDLGLADVYALRLSPNRRRRLDGLRPRG
jgi:NADH-quinone oxidoreductase subunit H